MEFSKMESQTEGFSIWDESIISSRLYKSVEYDNRRGSEGAE